MLVLVLAVTGDGGRIAWWHLDSVDTDTWGSRPIRGQLWPRLTNRMKTQTQYLPQSPIIPLTQTSGRNVSSMSDCQPRYLSRGMKTCDIILRPPPILRAGDWVMPWSAHSALSGCQVPSQHLMGSSSEKYASSTKRRPQVMISLAHHRSVWPRRHQLRTFSLFSDFRTAVENDGVSF